MTQSASIAIVAGKGRLTTSVGLHECRLTEKSDVGLTISGLAVIQFAYRAAFSRSLRLGRPLHLLVRISTPHEDLFCEGDFVVKMMELKTGEEQEAQYSFEVTAESGHYSLTDRI